MVRDMFYDMTYFSRLETDYLVTITGSVCENKFGILDICKQEWNGTGVEEAGAGQKKNDDTNVILKYANRLFHVINVFGYCCR